MTHWLGSFESLISSSLALAAPAKRVSAGATIQNRGSLIGFISSPPVGLTTSRQRRVTVSPSPMSGTDAGFKNPAAEADRMPFPLMLFHFGLFDKRESGSGRSLRGHVDFAPPARQRPFRMVCKP